MQKTSNRCCHSFEKFMFTLDICDKTFFVFVICIPGIGSSSQNFLCTTNTFYILNKFLHQLHNLEKLFLRCKKHPTDVITHFESSCLRLISVIRPFLFLFSVFRECAGRHKFSCDQLTFSQKLKYCKPECKKITYRIMTRQTYPSYSKIGNYSLQLV